jgi:hypothetical protein
MKKLVFLFAAFALSLPLAAQVAKDLLFAVQLDMVKSDYSDYFERAQGGIELNYFLSEHFTVTGGVEFWSTGYQVSGVLGGRWFPVKEAFVRARGLFGAKDFSFGGGWAKPLNPYWRFEAIGDVYLNGQIAIRASLAYMIRKKYADH